MKGVLKKEVSEIETVFETIKDKTDNIVGFSLTATSDFESKIFCLALPRCMKDGGMLIIEDEIIFTNQKNGVFSRHSLNSDESLGLQNILMFNKEWEFTPSSTGVGYEFISNA